jgi:MFS family permease
MTTGNGRVTYRQVLAVREFRALFLSQALSLFGDQFARIALALLVYERSGSAFGASATYACSLLTWIVGGPFLAALADRHSRRTIMIITDVARGLLVTLLLVPHPPIWAVFAVLVAIGLLAPPFESARSALLPDIVSGEHYVAGNTLMNTTMQAAQVGGFFLGGLMVALTSVRGALLIDVLTFAVSAAVIRLRIQDRPVTPSGNRLLADVTEGFRLVRHDPFLRGLLTFGVLASVVSIVPEGLAVAVAADEGHGAVAAGILTATMPAGYVVASTWLLRIPSDQRPQWLFRLTLLLCLPLLLTPLTSHPAATAVLWLVAGLGTSMQLIASVAFVAATPPNMRGRTIGLASTALMLAQGAGLLVAGAIADTAGARNVVAGAGIVGLILLLSLRRVLLPGQFSVQGGRESRRLPVR